jgi:hypothetical protein
VLPYGPSCAEPSRCAGRTQSSKPRRRLISSAGNGSTNRRKRYLVPFPRSWQLAATLAGTT